MVVARYEPHPPSPSNPEWGVINPHGTLNSWQVCGGPKHKSTLTFSNKSLQAKYVVFIFLYILAEKRNGRVYI